MTNLSKKIFICIVLVYFIQSIKCIDIVPETKAKITALVGQRQLALRSYLEEVKLETQKIDHGIQTSVYGAQNSLKTEVGKIINDIKSDTETKPCEDQMTKGIEEITKQSETLHNNCVSSAKSNVFEMNKAITKHGEFQTKIGETPKNCLYSNTDVDSSFKCIEKALEGIGKEMKESEIKINGKINEIKQQMDSVQNSLNSCQAKGLEDLKSKSKEVKDKFNLCIKP